MTIHLSPTHVPPAVAALDAYPALQRQVSPSIRAQIHRITERAAFVPPQEYIEALDAALRHIGGGLVLIEGPGGCGVTSLLCYLAATRPLPVWLPEDDAGAGLEALCAQLLALYRLPLPLVPPAAGRDATTLERLLSEASARAGDQQVVVVIGRTPVQSVLPAMPPFPAALPPNVVVLHAARDGCVPPLPVAARVALPAAGAPIQTYLLAAAAWYGCPPDLAAPIAAHSGGSFLYVRLAAGLLKTGLLHRQSLPDGLAELYQAWWQRLDGPGQHVAQILAAAGEPIPAALCAALAGAPQAGVARLLRRWRPLLELHGVSVALYHSSLRAFIAQQSTDNLAAAHAAYVALARSRSGGAFERLDPRGDAYFMRQLARHLALAHAGSPPQQADAAGPRTLPASLMQRPWILAQERRTGDHRAAAGDAAWELFAAAHARAILPLVRAAALAGTLALLGRTLPAEGLAEAFTAALQRGESREATLRRARALVDQLPSGRDKAAVLRRLGEACYAQRMRAQALRMLSEALDLEAPGLPRIWHDEREELLVAFARAAIGAGAPDMALGITTHIGHPERRGLIETEVVRWLLARQRLTRAEEVAYAIGHEHTHEWAMAEVAVGHARAGNLTRAEEVLSTLKTETAIAWARGELACDAAFQGDVRATEPLAALTSERLRDRALALVAQAFVAGDRADAALATARWIKDWEVRIRTLIDLAMLGPPNAATALRFAGEELRAVSGEERTPLIVGLATAQAAAGDLDQALQTAALLAAGEERDRAHSRIAVALARQGEHAEARNIALAIPDDDERFWTVHELAHLLAEAGDWRRAEVLADLIGDPERRARAEADLCIVQARAGNAILAQERATLITDPSERVRAYVAIADALVRQGGAALGLHASEQIVRPDARSRYQAALAAALAQHGQLARAYTLARTIVRPQERARALVALARVAAPQQREQALEALGEAFQAAAALGRAESFACLASAAEPLAALGGAEALLAAANIINEIDSWWA